MRVTGLRTIALRSQSPSAQVADAAPTYLLELTTDEAPVGTAVAPEHVLPAAHALTQAVLLREDPRAVRGLWQRLNDALGAHAPATARDAAALLDIALWDLKAKAQHEPLWRTLGGSRPRVPVHASARPDLTSDAALHDHYAAWAESVGVHAAVLRLSADRDADLRRIAILERALRAADPQVVPGLIADGDARWSPKDAIRHVRELERVCDLSWIEAPVARDDCTGLWRVSNAVRAAVCGGAGFDAVARFTPHLCRRSLDILQLDTQRLGITAALQLAEAAFGMELPVVLCDAPGHLGAQLAGALPNVMSLEMSALLPAWSALEVDVHVEQGWGIVGDAPGHGLRLGVCA